MEQLTKSKLCTNCGHCRGLQPLADFNRDSRSKDGRRSICKACRREQRLAEIDASKNGSPNDRQMTAQAANSFTPNAKNSFLAKLNTLWLIILFLGGFMLSTLNGSVAFLEAAAIISTAKPYMIAFPAAVILTLGTAVASAYGIRLIRSSRFAFGVLMLLMFVGLQSLNLIVNGTGVEKRLLITSKLVIQQKNEQQIITLEALVKDYRKTIERYPPVNERGEPVVWKQEITQTVKQAHEEIIDLNKKILVLGEAILSYKPEFPRHILLAWLVLPELCMLTAILVLSFGKIDEFKGENLEEEL